MNMTQSILDRELLTQNSILNIVLLGQEPKAFLDFLNKLSHKYILYDNLYYGNYHPNLIICNNKITHYDICRELSIRYHIPIITVDHYAKRAGQPTLPLDKIADDVIAKINEYTPIEWR